MGVYDKGRNVRRGHSCVEPSGIQHFDTDRISRKQDDNNFEKDKPRELVIC